MLPNVFDARSSASLDGPSKGNMFTPDERRIRKRHVLTVTPNFPHLHGRHNYLPIYLSKMLHISSPVVDILEKKS